jgi:hypothetical protein
MIRWTIIAALALSTAAYAEPGRTDGAENSEYGKGGYSRFRSNGTFYVEGFVGSAIVDIEYEEIDRKDVSQTDLITGLNVGYLVEDWLGFQLGYARIADQNTNFYSGGVRSAFNQEPFNYYFSLDAEIYSPEVGDDRFGIAPGAGIEVILHEHVRVGLRFQHDFIFADEVISINRFTAKLQFDF